MGKPIRKLTLYQGFVKPRICITKNETNLIHLRGNGQSDKEVSLVSVETQDKNLYRLTKENRFHIFVEILFCWRYHSLFPKFIKWLV